jgi:hypothetical protein
VTNDIDNGRIRSGRMKKETVERGKGGYDGEKLELLTITSISIDNEILKM